jgi:hypothetical protein
MLLGTLLPVILSSYSQLLQSVDPPSKIPPSARTVTVGDSPQGLTDFDNVLLGIVGAEYPWGAAVEVPAEKWAYLCRRVVSHEIYGDEDYDSSNPGSGKGGIMGIVDEMEARQHNWHEYRAKGHNHAGSMECMSGSHGVHQEGVLKPEKIKDDDAACLRVVNNVRKIAKAMGLTGAPGQIVKWYGDMTAR